MRRLCYIVAFILMVCHTGCKRGSTVAVPRPEGYPRLEAYPAAYSPLEGVAAWFEVNDSAVRMPDQRPEWVTLSYPRYGALLYLTFTPVTDATSAEVIDNRIERLGRNAGAGEVELTTFENAGGFVCQMVRSLSITATPLQLLAYGQGMVVSGTLFFPRVTASTPYDSIAPSIDAVASDLDYALEQLCLLHGL